MPPNRIYRYIRKHTKTICLQYYGSKEVYGPLDDKLLLYLMNDFNFRSKLVHRITLQIILQMFLLFITLIKHTLNYIFILITEHPNIKAFVTQGGLQSTDEAIDAGVPLVGIPLQADQWLNTEKYELYKIGITLEMENLTEDTLRNAIKTVVHDVR